MLYHIKNYKKQKDEIQAQVQKLDQNIFRVFT